MLLLKGFTREHGSIADMPRNNPCNVPIPCLARSPAYGNFDHAGREALKRAVFHCAARGLSSSETGQLTRYQTA